MNKFELFLDKHYRKIFLFLLLVIFFNTCSNQNKSVNKRLDSLTAEIDSLRNELRLHPTGKDLKIESLKAEKRMIQSTDRKILDVQRQSEIDKEIQKLQE